jgi:hypothetical protein
MSRLGALVVVAATAVVGLGLCALPLPSAAAPDSILGTWKLQSWVREIMATGKRENPLGEKPDGYLTYSPDGRMQAIITADNRITPSSVAPSDAEKLKLYGRLVSYAGTYDIDGDKVIHHIDISWNQTITGTDLVQLFKLEGDTLIITVPIQKSALDGQETRAVLTWNKLRVR